MSLPASPIDPVPTETARIAKAAFRKGCLPIRLRDALGPVYDNEQFRPLFATVGRPAEAPWRLALVLVFQFAEGLSDRQAASAVRGRIDWKYALSLPLEDPGFDFSVLSEFRTRLLAGNAEESLLETLLSLCDAHGWLPVRGKQRTDSTHILTAARTLNRLEFVGETVRAALNDLADVAPDWLQALSPLDWYERYAARVEDFRFPRGAAARTALAATIGADGVALLTAVYGATAPAGVAALPSVEVLRQVWIQQFVTVSGQVRLRTVEEQPPSGARRVSPYEPDARYSTKGHLGWSGYKLDVTESCDDDLPHLVTQVDTTPATVPDEAMTLPIQRKLAARDRAPGEHFLDSGFVTADIVVTSQTELGIDVVGPMRPDSSWQARAGQGYDGSRFRVDWAAQQVTCPEGHTSVGWRPEPGADRSRAVTVAFAEADCRACPVREQCTRARQGPRRLTLPVEAGHALLQQIRQEQTTAAWRERYGRRAGVEGTFAEGVQVNDLRQSRYIGLAKTHLQHVVTAVAINVARIDRWLLGQPRATTRISHFAALAPKAA